ncbi:MAG TPA: GNAT family N-acetyltransferase, partial [Chitinophagaceae bacterium]
MRSINGGSEAYWMHRLSGYLAGTHNPQQALPPRILYVASIEEQIVGFIAGHLTKRHACAGELQWIDVLEHHRRSGIASE